MKHLLILTTMLLCFQVNSQCSIRLETEMIGLKPGDSTNVKWFNNIPLEDVYFEKNISVFTLDTLEHYIFVFTNGTFEKQLWLKTSDVCGSVISFNINFEWRKSLKSVWNGTKYVDESFIAEE